MAVTPLRDDLMVQQQLPAIDLTQKKWQHMVAVIMLNQTGRKPVKTVLPEFLYKWPTVNDFLTASEDEIKEVIRPLGLLNVRCKRLMKMSMDFVNWDQNDAKDLYGIGKYGSDSYDIFFKLDYTVNPTDKELKRYLAEEV